jgi:chaperone modulatory protein CbpM
MSQETPALSGRILEEQDEFGFTEFCSICAVEERQIFELVEQGIIETHSVTQWRFSGNDLRRARISLRLQRDLGVNPAGTALVLDLLERIELLERRVRTPGTFAGWPADTEPPRL